MISVIEQTPSEYSKQSRDYQIIARLFTALFNMSKMYIDELGIWSNDIDDKLSFHRAITLNFRIRHSWDLDDLESVTTCFKYLMRRKGTATALEYCINILMKIEGVTSNYLNDIVDINNNVVTIRIPESVLTLGIVEDLVDYLLPTGFIYNVVTFKYITIGSEYVDPINLYAKTEKENVSHEEVQYTSKMYIGAASSEDENIITDTFIYSVDSEGKPFVREGD